jgi:GAF domain-containing protein
MWFRSLPGNDPSELAAIVMNAARFGLHTFCSEGVTAENDELLGFLEMYSSVPRDPTDEDLQLIERAKCLVAIAIKRHNEASHQDNGGERRNQGVRKRVLEWPVSRNQSSGSRVPSSQ